MSGLRFLILALLITVAHASESSSAATKPLHPAWAPVVVPLSLAVPGSGHWFRGENRAAWDIFTRAGAGFLGLIGLAAGVAATGAASGVMIPAVPLLVLSGSTFMSAGSMDAIGAFSDAEPAASVENSVVFTPRDFGSRLAASFLADPDPAFESGSYLRLEGSRQLDKADRGRLWVQGSFTTDSVFRNLFFESEGAVSFLQWGPEFARSRLLLSVNALHERAPDSLHSATRLQSVVLMRTPLAALSPTLRNLLWELSAGYQFRWTHYDSMLDAPDDFLAGVAGGFQLAWRMGDRWRSSWGYEHARDGLVGGGGTGYFGHLHAGTSYRVIESGWLSGRAYFGSPLVVQLGWEQAW